LRNFEEAVIHGRLALLWRWLLAFRINWRFGFRSRGSGCPAKARKWPVGVVGFEELHCDVFAKFAIALPLQLIKPLVGRALMWERLMLAMIVEHIGWFVTRQGRFDNDHLAG